MPRQDQISSVRDMHEYDKTMIIYNRKKNNSVIRLHRLIIN